jgi:hypothetical protein
MSDHCCFEYTAALTATSHEPKGEGAVVHGLIEMPLRTAQGRPRNVVEMEEEAVDLMLFTLQPGPYRCVSRSRVWQVEPGQVARLGPAPKVYHLGGATVHLYAS